MLVDLGRNDLGRVAQAWARCSLDESFVVERYSHVMHLVSTVSAELRDGVDALDVLAPPSPRARCPGPPRCGRWS